MSNMMHLDHDPRYSVDSQGNAYGPKGKLKPFKAVKGRYLQIAAGGKRFYLHRLIAKAFIPNPHNKPDVAHINGNGLDNRIENLRWSTEAENMVDKLAHGTLPIGERHVGSKLTDAQVLEIRNHREDGVDVDSLAEFYKVSRWTIYDAANLNRRKIGSDY